MTTTNRARRLSHDRVACAIDSLSYDRASMLQPVSSKRDQAMRRLARAQDEPARAWQNDATIKPARIWLS